jgi:hypothetical protein
MACPHHAREENAMSADVIESVASQVSKARTQGIIIGLVIGLIGGGIAGVMVPENSFSSTVSNAKTPLKPHPAIPDAPVVISLKGDGAARAVVIKNTGATALTGVKLDARNPRGGAAATTVIGDLGPGETKEVASSKTWSWTFAPGDVFEVSADGFAPKTLTAP